MLQPALTPSGFSLLLPGEQAPNRTAAPGSGGPLAAPRHFSGGEFLSPLLESASASPSGTRAELLAGANGADGRGAAPGSPASEAAAPTREATGSGTLTSSSTASLQTAAAAQGPGILVVGPDAGAAPRVKVLDPVTGRERFISTPYPNSFRGGVRVAVADVNGDTTPDIVTGTGPGGGNRVRVFDGRNGEPFPGSLGNFEVFSVAETDGVFVAAGDMTGDGRAEIIIGPDTGSTAPEVRVVSPLTRGLLFTVMAEDTDFTGGIRVAAGDVTGDGLSEIITANGPGGDARVSVFEAVSHLPIYNFFAADTTDRAGLYVAAADLTGDGRSEIITGTGARGLAEVSVFDGRDSTFRTRFAADDSTFTGGVRVTVADVNGDSRGDLVVGQGPSGGQVRAFDSRTLAELTTFTPYGRSFDDGLFLAGTAPPPPLQPLSSDPVVRVNLGNHAKEPSVFGVFYVFREGDTSGSLTVNFTVGGSAASGADYTPLGTSVTIPPGAPYGVVTVSPVSDSLNEDTETVILTLQPGSGYTIGSPSSNTVLIFDANGPDPISISIICGTTDLVGCAEDGCGNNPNPNSKHPVRYFDGTVQLQTTDLSSSGFGTPWGQTRSWTNAYGFGAPGESGSGAVVAELPYLNQDGAGTIAVVSNGTTARLFDLVSGSYQPRHFLQESLTYNGAAGEFTLTDTTGQRLKFHDFSMFRPFNQRGKLKSLTDQAGNVTSVPTWTSDGKPQEVQRSNTTGGTTVTESYLYSYLTSGANSGKMSNATLRRQVNGGAWSTVRQVEYTYYTGTEPFGNVGNLKTAVVKDGSGNALDTRYYRYYTPSDGNGYTGGLRYYFSPPSYARLAAAFADPFTASDAQVAPYADLYFEYDSLQRVTKEIVQGAGCSSCGSGQGTFTFSYATSTFADGYNSYRNKTVETLPDGNQNIVYTNFAAQVLLKVFKETATGNTWGTFYKYDNQGRLILEGQPSAVSGYDETRPDLLNNQSGNYQYLRDSSGLIETTS